MEREREKGQARVWGSAFSARLQQQYLVWVHRHHHREGLVCVYGHSQSEVRRQAEGEELSIRDGGYGSPIRVCLLSPFLYHAAGSISKLVNDITRRSKRIPRHPLETLNR